MEDAFDSDDLETVAERLVGMQGSLRLLSHVADYQVDATMDAAATAVPIETSKHFPHSAKCTSGAGGPSGAAQEPVGGDLVPPPGDGFLLP